MNTLLSITSSVHYYHRLSSMQYNHHPICLTHVVYNYVSYDSLVATILFTETTMTFGIRYILFSLFLKWWYIHNIFKIFESPYEKSDAIITWKWKLIPSSNTVQKSILFDYVCKNIQLAIKVRIKLIFACTYALQLLLK